MKAYFIHLNVLHILNIYIDIKWQLKYEFQNFVDKFDLSSLLKTCMEMVKLSSETIIFPESIEVSFITSQDGILEVGVHIFGLEGVCMHSSLESNINL